MIKRWYKNILKKKKITAPLHQKEKELIDLVDFLWKKIDTSIKTTNLKDKKEAFNQLPYLEKINSLPEIYLLLEASITKKSRTHQFTEKTIRNIICVDYPNIITLPNFSLLFQELKDQELILCKIFLIKVLEKASEAIGTFNDIEILRIKKYLYTPISQSINIIRERKELLESSSLIFHKIKNSLGENAITNIYLIVYQQHFQSYHLLDSFTATLNVIPEEIFAKELINFPSKQQMLKMLQKQLYSLEEVNERLTKEIVERKKIEEELKHSEHLKSRILETAMDGIILVNQDGIVLDWNKKAENILRVKKEETIGKSIYPLLPEKLRNELKDSFNSYLINKTGQLINKRVETSVYLKDRSVVYVELTIIAIKTKEEYLFNAFFRDITNKKIRDNEIREAKVFAEKSAKAKSIFLSNMSHEIRTPLNVILGLTSILQKSDFSDLKTDRTNLDGIQFSAENLLVLINDILDFSKIEAGKLTLHKTDFNIHELITNVSRGFKIKAEEKGLNYTTDIDPTLPKFIIGDQFRLNQILTNLLGNAIKFTKKGEVRITVTSEKKRPNTVLINFTVSDTGIGIPKDKLDNIFQSFYQVNEPGKNKIEGTGLGLSISKELIERQGGTLKVDSIPNKGSCFNFSIEYKDSKLISSKPHNNESSKTKSSDIISGMNVLVVEDNRMNQFFIKQLFANWNIKADIAENGKIALNKLENNTYDVILMDMHMPIMDGPETTIHIRNSTNQKIKNIPIIACSADVFPESKKVAIESGMNFYLTKPVSEKALEEILYSLKPDRIDTNYVSQTKSNPEKISINSDTGALCDFSILKKSLENDQEVIQSVLQIFLEETPEDYNKLQNAIKNDNLIVAKELAHKLKSSFKTLGLHKEALSLEQIEQSTQNSCNSNEILESITILDSIFPKIILEIKDHINDFTSLNT